MRIDSIWVRFRGISFRETHTHAHIKQQSERDFDEFQNNFIGILKIDQSSQGFHNLIRTWNYVTRVNRVFFFFVKSNQNNLF